MLIIKKMWTIILLLIVVSIILFFLGVGQDDTPLGFGCYYEEAILQKQYIDWTNSIHGGNCSDGCLFMDVYTEFIEFLPCGHVNKITWKNRTYFFANEGFRFDLKAGDNIKVKWCYINKAIGRRIRGIEKIQIKSQEGMK